MPPSARDEHGRYPSGGLHGQLVHELGTQIVNGVILPGEILPAPTGIAASRTVMREVVKVLVAKGLVESRPKTGTRVRPAESWNLLDPDVLAWRRSGRQADDFLCKLTEVRLVVEPAAAELAARRADAAQVEALDAAFVGMQAALSRDPQDYEKFDRHDIEFHKGIVRACGNELLEQMGQVVYSGLLLSFHATSRIPGKASESIPLHRAVLDAIRRRRPRRASQAMRRLVEVTGKSIEALAEPRD